MGIRIIRQPAGDDDIEFMLEELSDYIKLAVDIASEILAGGGEYHADCELALLQSGSRQKNIWGADWHPESGVIKFGALINIRPAQDNYGMEIENQALRDKIESIVRPLLEADN